MTKRLRMYRNHGAVSAAPTRGEFEPVVRGGLAMTPSDMARLTARGMPINQQNVGVFQDGEPNPSPYVTSERRRGVDVAELWEEHEKIVKKCKAARQAARKSKSE